MGGGGTKESQGAKTRQLLISEWQHGDESFNAISLEGRKGGGGVLSETAKSPPPRVLRLGGCKFDAGALLVSKNRRAERLLSKRFFGANRIPARFSCAKSIKKKSPSQFAVTPCASPGSLLLHDRWFRSCPERRFVTVNTLTHAHSEIIFGHQPSKVFYYGEVGGPRFRRCARQRPSRARSHKLSYGGRPEEKFSQLPPGHFLFFWQAFVAAKKRAKCKRFSSLNDRPIGAA